MALSRSAWAKAGVIVTVVNTAQKRSVSRNPRLLPCFTPVADVIPEPLFHTFFLLAFSTLLISAAYGLSLPLRMDAKSSPVRIKCRSIAYRALCVVFLTRWLSVCRGSRLTVWYDELRWDSGV